MVRVEQQLFQSMDKKSDIELVSYEASFESQERSGSKATIPHETRFNSNFPEEQNSFTFDKSIIHSEHPLTSGVPKV